MSPTAEQAHSASKTLPDALIDTVSELYDSIGARTFEILELNHRLQEELGRRQVAEDKIRELNRSLEQRVEERTSALTREIDERRNAESAALDYSTQLQEMTRRYVGVQETERRSLARELHDRVSSSLSAIALSLGVIGKQLAENNATELMRRLEDTIGLVKETIASTRDVSFDLHPAVLDYSGVLAALDDYARKYMDRTGIDVEVSGTAENLRLPADCESALYRIAQEALTNCAKHAHANKVTIEFDGDDEHARLTIYDDGTGFDSKGVASTSPGLGLLSMRERAEAIGARFKIESLAERGTRIVVSLQHGAQPETPRSAVGLDASRIRLVAGFRPSDFPPTINNK